MRASIKAVLAAAVIIATASPALAYEQSETPENNGRNMQQVQPGPAPLLTQLLQARPAPKVVRPPSAEQQFFERAVGTPW
jgi:hypothetical protein